MDGFWIRIGDSGVTRHGHYQAKPDVVVHRDSTHIVLRTTGYTMNPGSRNSGLLSYYPGEVLVCRFTGAVRDGAFRVEVVTRWSTARKRKP